MESFNNRRAPVYAKHGIACSSQPLAATVGRDILKAGGNAADAAIAMAAMVNVTEPMMNGLGGDSFMLVHWKGKFQGLNASGRSGAKFSIAALKAAGFTAMPDAGGATVSVPGALDGYLALHEKFGSMELKDLLEPAAKHAEEGYAVSLKVSKAWSWGASKLERFSPTADVYLPGGKAPVAGQIFAQPDLAATWRKVGREGRAAFYAGDIRDRILEVLSKNGGFLEAADFKTVQAEWVAPISASYRGHRILELPPNGQGIVVLMALRILEKFDMQASFESDPAAAAHLVLEALKLAFADSNRAVGDPRFSEVPVEKLLSDSFINERHALIQPGRAIDNPTSGRIYGDTTYLTVMDKDRNAVSLITSISDIFGSGIIVPGTGVILHNRSADFVMEEGHPNSAAPGKRVRHTILPAMMLNTDGSLRLSFGCMGGNMQPQGQLQILLNLIDRGMNIQQAIDAPRVRVLDGRRISIEPHLETPDFAKRLTAMGHIIVEGDEVPADWTLPHDFCRSFEGSAQAIQVEHGRASICGASDPRLDGIACPL
jgi:gamma-glutamyltranspeptidase / glutathione hydrolase